MKHDPSKRPILCLVVPIVGLLALASLASAETLEKEIEASSGQTLELNLDTGGSVNIEGWNRETVSVVAEAPNLASYEIEIRSQGDKIVVDSDIKEKSNRWTSRLGFTIQVPKSFNVDIESSGGHLKILNVEGSFEGRTMGGKIELRDLRGEARLETMGGDVLVVDSELDGKVTTMGGKVTMRDLYGDLDGTSMGGNVSLERVTRRNGENSGDAVIISTMGGAIDVTEAPAGAKLKTMGGDVEVGSASEYVDAETMGGNIRLDQVDGWVKALTMGGDIDVKVIGDGGGEGHIELESMSGDVRLVVPPGLGFEVDIELAYTRGHRGRHEIKTDLPLEFSETDSWDRSHGTARRYRRAQGTVGDGSHRLVIRTVNGDIVLEQGR